MTYLAAIMLLLFVGTGSSTYTMTRQGGNYAREMRKLKSFRYCNLAEMQLKAIDGRYRSQCRQILSYYDVAYWS